MDKSNIDELIKKIKPHEIYHLAAQSHVGISFRSPFLTTQIDCIGALNVLESVKSNSPSSNFIMQQHQRFMETLIKLAK